MWWQWTSSFSAWTYFDQGHSAKRAVSRKIDGTQARRIRLPPLVWGWDWCSWARSCSACSAASSRHRDHHRPTSTLERPNKVPQEISGVLMHSSHTRNCQTLSDYLCSTKQTCTDQKTSKNHEYPGLSVGWQARNPKLHGNRPNEVLLLLQRTLPVPEHRSYKKNKQRILIDSL